MKSKRNRRWDKESHKWLLLRHLENGRRPLRIGIPSGEEFRFLPPSSSVCVSVSLSVSWFRFLGLYTGVDAICLSLLHGRNFQWPCAKPTLWIKIKGSLIAQTYSGLRIQYPWMCPDLFAWLDVDGCSANCDPVMIGWFATDVRLILSIIVCRSGWPSLPPAVTRGGFPCRYRF